MRFTITIEDRLGQDIKSFCKANGLSITEYVLPIIENQFNIDRYGDMNEMIGLKSDVETKVVKIEQPSEEPIGNQDIKKTVQPEINQIEQPTEPPKRKKRQLKVK